MTTRRTLPTEPLTREEVLALMKASSNRAPTGIRNRALVAALWRCGLRVAEALALLPKDIDTQEGTVRILRGKGSKSRVVPMDPDALAVVQRWMDKRGKLRIGPRRPLFCTLKGGPMADAYIREMLPRLARRAGIVKRVHAHGLRHTYAVDLRKENVDVGIISKALGHSNIGTTSIYLNHVMPRDVIDALRNRRWSGTEAAGAGKAE